MASSDLIVRVKMADVGKFVADGKSVQSTTDGIGDAADRAGRVGSGGFGLISKALTVLRRTAFLAGGSMTALSALVIKNGLSYNAAFQSATTSFTTLLGSSDKAKKLMDDLREVSNGTPLRFTEVLDASKRMLGMGVSADRTVDVLKGLNAAILATGGGSEQFDRASLALGQIEAKGKASAEELMQLAEAGVPVNKILQKELGMTAQEVSEIGKSGIASGKVLDAIARGWQREFGKAAKNARNDWNNQTAQITKDWEQFQRIVTEPLFIKLNTDVMPRVMRTIRAATKGFQQGFEQGGVMAGFDLMFRRMDIAAGAGGRLIKGWRELVSIGSDLGRVVTDGIVPAFRDIASATGGLLSPLGLSRKLLGFLADNASKLRPIIVGLVAGYVAWRTAVIASNTVTAISNNLKFIAAVRSKGLTTATNMQTAATGRATIAQRVLNAVMRMNPIGIVITAIVALAAGIYIAYQRSETFRNAVQWLWDKIKSAFFWIRDNWKLLAVILGGPIGAAVVFIASKWDSIKTGARNVIDWFKSVWSGIKSALTAPFQGAWTVISGIFRQIKAAISFIQSAWPGGGPSSRESLDAVSAASPNAERGRPGQGGGSWGGSLIARGGSLVVGERGRELVTLPAGASIHRNSATEQALAGQRDVVIHVHTHIDGREVATNTVRHVMAAGARA